MRKTRVVIIGAAGRDFHNFNTVFRDNPQSEVIAFTASQIPNIAGRRYPPSLAGRLYPKGIPIKEEKELEKIITDKKVDECVLSYSDISYETVMHIGSRVLASGAKFSLLGVKQTMLKSKRPLIAVLAVRTGCGKSQTSRAVVDILRQSGRKVVSIRHPMPYGDLAKQKVQRYEKLVDLKKYECTIEEMEEYEPHIAMGSVIYSGVDYAAILKEAEKEAEIIVWDGGNNDTCFYQPDLSIVITDPLRAGHELKYFPGEVNLRMADVIVINKINSADAKDIELIAKNVKAVNPKATIIKAESVVSVEQPELIRGKKVLVVEDGPTVTHGEMRLGAGIIAAKNYGAAKIVDPRPYVVGKIKETFAHYPNIGPLLPAVGYSAQQMQDLERTINRVDCETVIIGTPIDLARFIKINKPTVRVRYELSKSGKEGLRGVMSKWLGKLA